MKTAEVIEALRALVRACEMDPPPILYGPAYLKAVAVLRAYDRHSAGHAGKINCPAGCGATDATMKIHCGRCGAVRAGQP